MNIKLVNHYTSMLKYGKSKNFKPSQKCINSEGGITCVVLRNYSAFCMVDKNRSIFLYFVAVAAR